MTSLLLGLGIGDVERSTGRRPPSSATGTAAPIAYEDAFRELERIQGQGRKARVPEVAEWRTFGNCVSDAWIYSGDCSPERVEAFIYPRRLYERIRASLREHIARRPNESASNVAHGQWAQRMGEWCAVAQAALNIRYTRWLWAHPESQWATYEGERYGSEESANVPGWMWSPRVRALLAHWSELATRELGAPAIVRPWLHPKSCAWSAARGRPYGPTYTTHAAFGYPLPTGRPNGLTPDEQMPPRLLSVAEAARFGMGTNGWEMAGASGIRPLGGRVFIPNRAAMCELLALEAQSIADLSYEAALIQAAEAWFSYVEGFDLETLGLTPEELAAVGEAMAQASDNAASASLAGVAGVVAIVPVIGGVLAALVAVFGLIAEAIGWARGSACPAMPRPVVFRTMDGDCLSVVQSGRAIGEAPLGTSESAGAIGVTLRFPPRLNRALDTARERRDERRAESPRSDNRLLYGAAALGVAALLMRGAR